MTGESVERRIRKRVEFVYGAAKAGDVVAGIMRLVAKYARATPTRTPKPRECWSQKDALLITYGDSIVREGKRPLGLLREFLSERVGDLVTFLHVLAVFPYSSDDGFAVKDFRAVAGELGDWSDVEALARDYRLVVDGVINHVSASSVYMKGYAAGESQYEDFFISLPRETDTSSVLRTRNLPLLHDYETSAGKRWLWTTFSRDHVDLNFANPKVLLEILDVLLFYAASGAAAIRLDAIPYLWKELGTSCAHLPQTHAIIKLIRDVYDLTFPGVILLTETNVPHHENLSYFGDGGDEAQMIYNFSLPPMILHAIVTGSAAKLSQWAGTIEKVSDAATYLNITATHDGIGMRPSEGLLTAQERQGLVDLASAHNGGITGKTDADGGVSVYELNVNYFDAVNDPNADEPVDLQVRRFMLSQQIALSFIGIPGIYIHSLLGSRNNTAAVARTGRRRSINRARLALGALEGELDDTSSLRGRVFAEYRRLLAIRREESAFHPDAEQEVLDLDDAVLALVRRRERSGESVIALHNVSNRARRVDLPTGVQYRDLLAAGPGGADIRGKVTLGAYQCRWLKAVDAG